MTRMPTPYHLSEHRAEVLLRPIVADLARLEGRARHYAERVRMSDAARHTIAAAVAVLAESRSALAKLALDEEIVT